MAELAVRDGWPSSAAADLPRGEFICTSLASGGIRIDHADPRILISAELLDAIVDCPASGVWLDLTGCTTYDGGVLKISGVNRTVIYRIVEYVPQVHGYIAEWPD